MKLKSNVHGTYWCRRWRYWNESRGTPSRYPAGRGDGNGHYPCPGDYMITLALAIVLWVAATTLGSFYDGYEDR